MTKVARNVTARRISPTADMLGESPVWDPQNATLYWVDGVSRLIRMHDTLAGTFRQIKVPSMIGSIGLALDGKLVAGLADGIYLVDIVSGECTPLYSLPRPSDRIRFNDGKVDRQGRFLCGSMGVFAESCGELIRVDSTGKADVLANGIRIANSLCFSPDGATMYFSDSLDRKVRAYAYDKEEGALDRPGSMSIPPSLIPDPMAHGRQRRLHLGSAGSGGKDRPLHARRQARLPDRGADRHADLHEFRRTRPDNALPHLDQGFRIGTRHFPPSSRWRALRA
jgi:sugar lactone lactonase YvrE